MQNRLLLVEVTNVLIQIAFDAKSTSTSRSEKCVDSNRFRCKISQRQAFVDQLVRKRKTVVSAILALTKEGRYRSD